MHRPPDPLFVPMGFGFKLRFFILLGRIIGIGMLALAYKAITVLAVGVRAKWRGFRSYGLCRLCPIRLIRNPGSSAVRGVSFI
jgi:hypothetical protein